MDATVELPANTDPRPARFAARGIELLAGISCGLYLTAWLHRALAMTGSPVSRLALYSVVLTALVLSVVLVRRTRGSVSWRVVAAIHTGLFLFAVCPILMTGPASLMTAALASDAVLDSAMLQWLVSSIALAVGWLLPLTLTFTLLRFCGSDQQPVTFDEVDAQRVTGTRPRPDGVSSARLTSMSLGIVFAVFVPGLLSGSTAIALSGTLTGCVALALAPRHTRDAADTACGHVVGQASRLSVQARRWHYVWLPIAVAAGMLFAALRRLLDQLFLDTAWLTGIEWAALLTGTAIGLRLAARQSRLVELLPLMTAIWSVVLLAAFPVWVAFTLDLKATVSVALISMLLKVVAAVCVIAPLGGCLGISADRSHSGHWLWQLALTFCLGAALTEWLAIPQLGQVATVSLASCTLVVATVARRWTHSAHALASVATETSPEPAPFWRGAMLAGAVCLLLCAGHVWALRSYNPAQSAKLLFDTRVFTASHSSLKFELLPWLNEERCLDIVETPERTLTLWKMRGSQIQLRECGVPLGVLGCETNVGPQLSAESLQAILPLTLHERPQRILLTGTGSGSVLQTSLHFPLTTIDCIEPDRHLLNAVTDRVLSRIAPSPLDDDRVRIRCCDPLLALPSLPADYDVVLCRPSQPVLARAAAESTADYLTSVAGCLSEDGLCAQPLDIVDFGPTAVRTFVRTWQSVFADVAAIEIAPGRLLLIGTNSSRGVYRYGFIDRLQHPHVRYALAQTGWDWSTPLQLAAWSQGALDKIFTDQSTTVARVSNTTLTCWLPWEVTRWGDKFSRVTTQLSTQSSTLQMLDPTGSLQAPDIEDRLTELREQRDLIRHETDEYWAYRKVTKRMLTESPRSELVHVKGEVPVHRRHEEDKLRLEYFKALGAAARNTTAENLHALAAFDQPYDPLVTFFMHQEVAELASRDRARFADIELQHRLYRAHYTAPGDESVRNVVAAIELLCSEQAAEFDPVWRGDHLDALLQVLQERWSNRGDIQQDSSRVMLVDVTKSIAAVDQALDVMPDLCAARGLSPDDWAARRLVLEKLLVRPLRTSRTMLLPRHEREQRRNK